MIAYEDLVKLLDYTHRWTYRGSLTTPPCLSSATDQVYWNVLANVYPVSQKHVNQYLNLMQKETDSDGFNLAAVGNWREI